MNFIATPCAQVVVVVDQIRQCLMAIRVATMVLNCLINCFDDQCLDMIGNKSQSGAEVYIDNGLFVIKDGKWLLNGESRM